MATPSPEGSSCIEPGSRTICSFGDTSVGITFPLTLTGFATIGVLPRYFTYAPRKRPELPEAAAIFARFSRMSIASVQRYRRTAAIDRTSALVNGLCATVANSLIVRVCHRLNRPHQPMEWRYGHVVLPPKWIIEQDDQSHDEADQGPKQRHHGHMHPHL